MKSLLGVLSLVLVLVYSQADPAAPDAHPPFVCPDTRLANEMDHLNGDWVLDYAAYGKEYKDSMPNMVSSFVTLRVQSDNHTLFMTERTSYDGGKCAHYMFLSHDDPHDGHLHLVMVGGTENKDGATKVFRDNATMDFYPSADNELKMHYKGHAYGNFLLSYRRAGQHWDQLGDDHHHDTELAKCLHLHGENFEEWRYQGQDFCHKSSVLPTLDDHELHQVEGDWVLLWMVREKNRNSPCENLLSSRMHLHVEDNNHTVNFQEYNYQDGKCVKYSGNFVLPEGNAKVHRLLMNGATEESEGVSKPFEDTATLEFFPSPDNVMEVYYKSEKYGKFLLEYRREGHHMEVEGCERDKHHEEHVELAKYLGLSGDNFEQWHYDGKTDLCRPVVVPSS